MKSTRRFEVIWSLAITVAAVIATCFAVVVWNDLSEHSGMTVVAVIAFTAFAWFGAACEWLSVLRQPDRTPTKKFRVVNFTEMNK